MERIASPKQHLAQKNGAAPVQPPLSEPPPNYLVQHDRLRRLIHDARNPLTAIQLGSETLGMMDLNASCDEVVCQILQDVRRLADLLSSLAPDRTSDLVPVLHSMMRQHNAILAARGVTIGLECFPDKFPVCSRFLLLFQNWFELLLTAVGDGTTITIEGNASSPPEVRVSCVPHVTEFSDVSKACERVGHVFDKWVSRNLSRGVEQKLLSTPTGWSHVFVLTAAVTSGGRV